MVDIAAQCLPQSPLTINSCSNPSQAAAPDVIQKLPEDEATATATCANANCTVDWKFTTEHLHGYNQYAVAMMRLHKPMLNGQSTFDSFGVDIPLFMYMNVTGIDADKKRHSIEWNVPHTRTLHCPSNADKCDAQQITSFTNIRYPQYQMAVTIPHPAEAFTTRDERTDLIADFWVLTVNKSFTTFELGFKYMFVGIAAFLCMIYSCWVCGLPYAAQTREQHAIAWLLAALVLFNDPFFAAAVVAPSPSWPIVASFGTTLGLVALMTYWLMEFDLIRLMGEARKGRSNAVETGACFWAPKLALMALLFMSTIGVQWYFIYFVQADPGFNIWEEDSFGRAMAGFAVFLAAVYLLWVIVLAILVLRVVRFVSPSYAMSFGLTCLASIMSISAFFAGAFFGHQSGILFLAMYGSTNLYVLYSVWIFWPDRAGSKFDDMTRAEQRDVGYAVQFSDSAAIGDVDLEMGAFSVDEDTAAAAALSQDETSDIAAATFGIGDMDDEEDEDDAGDAGVGLDGRDSLGGAVQGGGLAAAADEGVDLDTLEVGSRGSESD